MGTQIPELLDCRALLLEDDLISLELYRRILGRACEVVGTQSADEALRGCAKGPVSLVVADNLLRGGKSGVEVLTLAHAIRPKMPLLLVSGTPPEGFSEADFKSFAELVHEGALAFLQKPFTAGTLIALAMQLMRGTADAAKTEQLLETALQFRRIRRAGS